ncbi:MAG: fatty acid desaturase [Rhodobacteraceae bacterium]|nr:fatty acid desaturase [Paracoccaceae bacterium]
MRRARDAVEWPTLALIGATYAIWGLGTSVLYTLSAPLGFVLATLAIVQFSSLQHEVLHGHPFRHRRLNEALVFPGLTLFVPYGRFRDTHLAHHRDERLTDPYDDPESNYLDPAVWARLPGPVRALLRANNTLLGRMVLGPAISTWSFVRGDLRAIRAGDRAVAAAWAWHVPGVALVALWLWAVPGMGWAAYLGAAYAAYGILKIRTFLEHRAHEKVRCRTAIVEDRGPLAFLFLNNNLHVVHHARPGVAWYRLPAAYRERKEEWQRRNEAYVYRSYAEIFARYLFRAKDPVPHPLWPDRMDRAPSPEETPAAGPAPSAGLGGAVAPAGPLPAG